MKMLVSIGDLLPIFKRFVLVLLHAEKCISTTISCPRKKRIKLWLMPIIFIFLLSNQVNAQWVKIYGGDKYEQGRSIVQTADSGYLVTGNTFTPGVRDDAFLVFRLDGLGGPLWYKTYGDEKDYFTQNVIPTDDEGYLLHGYTKDQNKAIIFKIDDSGNVLWQKNFGDNLHTNRFMHALRTQDGIIITGDSKNNTKAQNMIWVSKLSPDGEPLWEKQYGNEVSLPSSTCIEQTDDDSDGSKDDGFIVTGWEFIEGSSGGLQNAWAALVIKLDPEGEITWQKRYFAGDSSDARSISQTNDGGYIFIGQVQKFPDELSGRDEDILIVKLRSNGEIDWNRVYGGDQFEFDVHILATSDNGFLVATNTSTFTDGQRAIWLLKLDQFGNSIWQRTLDHQFIRGPKGVLYETSDGNYILAGTSNTLGNGHDTLILNLDADGSIPLCGYIGSTDASPKTTTIEVQDTDFEAIDIVTPVTDTQFVPQTPSLTNLNICPQDPDVSVFILDYPDPAQVGGPLHYSVQVENNGPVNVTGIALTDDLPATVQFVSVDTTEGECTQIAGQIQCSLNELPSGASWQIHILVEPTSEEVISNTVTVSGNDFDPIEASAQTAVCGADLSIRIQDLPDPVREGYYIAYVINVTNGGHVVAPDVTLVDTIPENVEFISAQATQGICSGPAGGRVTCHLEDVLSQQTATISILVRTLEQGSLYNSASVTSGLNECDVGNNTSESITRVRSFLIETIDNGCCPSMDLDTRENIHLSYTHDGDFRHATNETNQWQKTTVGANANEAAPTSAVAIDSSDNVHVCFGENSWDLSNPRLTWRERVDGTWQSAVTPVSGGPGFWPISMDMDSQDNLHISYNASSPGTMDGTLYYLSNVSGSWGSPLDLGDAYDHVALKTDADNNVHLSYYKIWNGLVYRTNAPDGIWQTPETVDPLWHCGQCEGMITDIDIFTDNRPHISYAGALQEFGNEDIKYAFLDANGNWVIEKLADGEFSSAGNAIFIDANGNTHISHYNKPDGTFRYSNNIEESWQQETFDDSVFKWLRCQSDIVVDSKGFVHIAYDDSYKVKHASKLILQDSDYDGVADFREMGPDGNDPGYDGNNDGEADSGQENATSLHTHDDAEYVTLASPEGTMMADVEAAENPSPLDSPADQEFPVGFFEFTIYGLEPGGSTMVTLILPDGMTLETYYKFGPTPDNSTPHWYEFSYDSQTQTGAVINGNTIVLHLVDGQRGDHDITVNGIIVEPGSPAIEKIKACENDTDEDGDVDGADLATLIDLGATDIDKFAEDFGRVNCP